MEKELVLKIIANGEGIQTEFKRASSSIPSDVYETINWMQWMDFDTKYALHIEKALKNIPLQGIATELKGKEALPAMLLYAKRFAMPMLNVEKIVAHLDPHVCYKIVPELIVLFDEVNFPKDSRQEFRLQQ